MVLPSEPIVVYMLARRDDGGDSARVRGVGPARARTALPLVVVVVLRAILTDDPRVLEREEEECMVRRRLRIWKDERRGGLAI